LQQGERIKEVSGFRVLKRNSRPTGKAQERNSYCFAAKKPDQNSMKLHAYEFDPARDIRVEPSGALEWNSSKPELHRSMRSYFVARMEDG
jgi:hypothetical protein